METEEWLWGSDSGGEWGDVGPRVQTFSYKLNIYIGSGDLMCSMLTPVNDTVLYT